MIHEDEDFGGQRDYKAERDTLIDDIAVLRANNEKLERELENINKHEDGLVSTVKLKDELLKESGEKIAELERENECEKEWFYKYSCELEHIVKHERDTIKRLERENEKLFLSEVDLQEKVNHCLEEVVKVTDKYTTLINHIRDMKFASPYSYNYIHLVNFIKELERADDER